MYVETPSPFSFAKEDSGPSLCGRRKANRLSRAKSSACDSSARQLTHPRLQRDPLAVDDERAVAVMVDGPCVLVLGVAARL